jgi:hypothetical protein
MKPGNTPEQAPRGPPGSHSSAKQSRASVSVAADPPKFAGHFGKGIFGNGMGRIPWHAKTCPRRGGDDWKVEKAGGK